jgi:hypothetical protein
MYKDRNELVKDLRRGTFHIDCNKIELTRESDGKCHIGPGYIRQRRERDFEVKLYAAGGYEFREFFESLGKHTAGVLVGAAHHFTLNATDNLGRVWKAERIINPQQEGGAGKDGHVVTANCFQVSLTEPRHSLETGNWTELRSFKEVEFPYNLRTEETVRVGNIRFTETSRSNAAKFVSNGFEFGFENNDGLQVLAAAADLPLPPMFDDRVTEAITFVLGAIPQWASLTRSQGGETITRFRWREERPESRGAIPPFRFYPHDPTNSVWNMFDLYLSLTLKDQGYHVHPLSQCVNSVMQARGSSVQGQALAVAVAVESLLERFYKEIGIPDATTTAKVDDLMAHLRRWGVDADISNRALGSLGGLKRARSDDRLRQLVARGAVGETERLAWKELRNTAAHGNWDRFDDRFQDLVDLTYRVLGLLHQLVFDLIGYIGWRTDYGTHGWPEVEYPSKVPPPTGSAG